MTINCTLFNDADPERVASFFDDMKELGIEGVTVSPGYAYERAPDQQHFLNRAKTKQLFRDIFKRGNGGKKWPFFQSGLFLDFLAGTARTNAHHGATRRGLSSAGSARAICWAKVTPRPMPS